jgi:UDP-2,3-diacylglucosamine hydrolase
VIKPDAPPLAILCGAGSLPLEVAADAERAGRPPFLIGVVGASEHGVEHFPHVWVRMGEVGKLFAVLKERRIGEIVLIGAFIRPEFSDLRLDWGAIRKAAELAQLFRRGDNGLLVGLAAIFEREGVRVVGAHDVAPGLLAAVGPLGARRAAYEDEQDIAFGAGLLEALSAFDAGQGAVIAAGRTLAIEAAEGTDAMLERLAEMRANGRLKTKGPSGIFVKAPKRGQDLRLDLPAIGERTIEAAARAQLRGIALAAGRVLIAERGATIRAADRAGLFVQGFGA